MKNQSKLVRAVCASGVISALLGCDIILPATVGNTPPPSPAPSSNPNPSPSVTPQPTATPRPTATPSPTASPKPTPVPTASPAPTPLPSSTPGPLALPSGWLYTIGNKILLSNGNGGGTPWMGRGANMDDVFFCGYNNTLWMSNAEKNVTDVGTGMVKNWKANFMRISLSMNSNAGQVYSWTSNPAKDPKAAKYQTPMTSAINAISANPGVHVLVTVRSDVSMVEDMNNGDPEATGVPTAATDSTYVALVDTFAQNGSILFGLSNEPGGGGMTDTKVMWDAMSHAVGAIRAEEDRLSAPHHIVSVQGTNWTSKIGFYSTKPLPYDNVVYEVHGYPPTPDQYTFSNIPVIIGEYGSLPNSSAFFADIEAKQIPNLAWDFDPFNNCAPDLLNITGNASSLVPSAWGTTVLNYLMSK